MRVLYDGAWGFASSPTLTLEEARRVAAEAVDIAKASAIVRDDCRCTLAEQPIYVDVFRGEQRSKGSARADSFASGTLF